MRKYDSYKDSGIEWIGEIPSHWDSSRYRYFYFSNMGVTLLKEDVKEDGIYPVYSATETDVLFGYVDEASVILNEGDIVIPARGNSIGHIKVVTTPSTSTQTTIYSKKISQNIETNFVKYFLQGLREHLFQFDRTAIPQITVNQVKNNPLVIPIPEEQTAIAAYLDRKTAEIDELIADKKRLLELYEEEKTAIINQAVTKGINPDAPMKDSGIEWLGDIPEHWEVKRLKYVASINDEVLTEKTEEDFEIEYVEISGVKSGIGIVETSTYRFKEAPSRARRIVRDGDVLVSTVRTYLKSIAKVDNPPENLIASTGFAVVRPNNINSDYTGFLFYSEPLIGEIISLSTGVSYPAINASQIGDIKIPIPPNNEQIGIAEFIENYVFNLNKQKEKTEKLIELLTEYRTALISEVVTGKIKVIE